jgi:hypothetical protein
MMGQPKPLASLSGGLLARKGGARPAMRPQGFASLASTSQALDDLGWNDMGSPEPVAPAPVVQLSPVQPAPAEPIAGIVASPEPVPTEAPVPQVLVERQALAQEFEPPVAVRPVSVATATRLRRETAHTTKSAFTLRLDQDRHLQLRLASALTGRSAQALVTQALDQFVLSLPDVAALVEQLPPAKRAKR